MNKEVGGLIMSKGKHTYPESITGETSDIEVSNIRRQMRNEGFKADREEGRMIKTVIKTQNDMVLVFDAAGEQICGYQGHYGDVKARILGDAPSGAVFAHWPGLADEPVVVPRGGW